MNDNQVKMSELDADNYGQLLGEIKQHIRSAQYEALKAVSENIRSQAKLAVKDEYTFDFLELADEHSERQLEQAILSAVEPFLQEMGEGCLPLLAVSIVWKLATRNTLLICYYSTVD